MVTAEEASSHQKLEEARDKKKKKKGQKKKEARDRFFSQASGVGVVLPVP